MPIKTFFQQRVKGIRKFFDTVIRKAPVTHEKYSQEWITEIDEEAAILQVTPEERAEALRILLIEIDQKILEDMIIG
jgi:hypothetical protein